MSEVWNKIRSDSEYEYLCLFDEDINMLALGGLKEFDFIKNYFLWDNDRKITWKPPKWL